MTAPTLDQKALEAARLAAAKLDSLGRLTRLEHDAYATATVTAYLTELRKRASEIARCLILWTKAGELENINTDRLRADLREAADLLEAIGPGWQDIETAPKDGTRILLAAIGNSDRLKNGAVANDPMPRVWWASSGRWSDKWGRFWDGFEPSGFAGLSHWMPLPAPPTDD